MQDIIELLREGNMHAGSDESVKYGYGAHDYGFTSGNDVGTLWGVQ